MIVIVCGLPGSGKTFFATSLAKCIDALYIGSDEVRNSILKNWTYSYQEKQLVYDCMLSKMKAAIQEKKTVLLDATFYKDEIREKFVKAATGCQLVFIEIICDEHISRERVRHKRDHTEADEKVYELIKSEWEPIKFRHLVLDSSSERISNMLSKTFQYLKR